MTDTRDKLLEAMYFFGQMEKNSAERDTFRYNLSAFLSAARSVTLIMQNEFDKITGFGEWYSNKQVEMNKDEIWKFFNEKRVATIHQGPIKPLAHYKMTICNPITFTVNVMSLKMIIKRTDGTIEERKSEPEPPLVPDKHSEHGEITTEVLWYFDDLQDKDIVTLSKEYLSKLENIVTECESKYTS
jgi:hypothetical protein